jgi:putative transposase
MEVVCLTGGMPAKKHLVKLSSEERAQLEKVSQANRRSVREKTRARILLWSDTGVSREEGGSLRDSEIAAQLKVSPLTVSTVRQSAHERGALACVRRQEQHTRKARILDGEHEAQLIAIACSAPPEGAARWSLRLLRERLIEMEVVENIGRETIRTTLKKINLNHG